MNLDTTTSVVRRAVDVLFLFNPRATSVGLLLGVVADGFTSAWNFELYQAVAAGILLCNLPSLIAGRRELPKEIEDALEVIRRTRGTLSATQIRMQYLAVVEKATHRVIGPSGPPKPA
jgi:hypothetical protein